MTKDILLTLNEAAEVLRLKDNRTLIKWAREGRIRVIGEKRHLLVDAESIDEYRRGESKWHRARNENPAAAQAPAPSGSSRAVNSRSRQPSQSAMTDTDTIILRRDRKLQRT